MATVVFRYISQKFPLIQSLGITLFNKCNIHRGFKFSLSLIFLLVKEWTGYNEVLARQNSRIDALHNGIADLTGELTQFKLRESKQYRLIKLLLIEHEKLQKNFNLLKEKITMIEGNQHTSDSKLKEYLDLLRTQTGPRLKGDPKLQNEIPNSLKGNINSLKENSENYHSGYDSNATVKNLPALKESKIEIIYTQVFPGLPGDNPSGFRENSLKISPLFSKIKDCTDANKLEHLDVDLQNSASSFYDSSLDNLLKEIPVTDEDTLSETCFTETTTDISDNEMQARANGLTGFLQRLF